jgi:hypothetical protein
MAVRRDLRSSMGKPAVNYFVRLNDDAQQIESFKSRKGEAIGALVLDRGSFRSESNAIGSVPESVYWSRGIGMKEKAFLA